MNATRTIRYALSVVAMLGVCLAVYAQNRRETPPKTGAHPVGANYPTDPSAWSTIFDIDLTAQGNQTFGSDTTFTYAGYTWTKGNSANEVSHAASVNGTGLQFVPAAATDYNGATRTLPYLWLPFSQVFPAATYTHFGWNTKIRLWIDLDGNPAANYDGAVFGVDSNSTALGLYDEWGFILSGQGAASTFNINAANLGFSADTFTLTSFKTIMFELPGLLPYQERAWRAPGQAGNVAFPALGGNFTPSAFFQAATTQSFVPAPGLLNPNTGLGIFLAAHRAGSGTSLTITYKRIRLDYQFND